MREKWSEVDQIRFWRGVSEAAALWCIVLFLFVLMWKQVRYGVSVG